MTKTNYESLGTLQIFKEGPGAIWGMSLPLPSVLFANLEVLRQLRKHGQKEVAGVSQLVMCSMMRLCFDHHRSPAQLP
jgi:hypothetical protein